MTSLLLPHATGCDRSPSRSREGLGEGPAREAWLERRTSLLSWTWLSSAWGRVAVVALSLLLALVSTAGRAGAQAEEPTNFVTPPASDYVVEGPSTRLELVLDDGARGPTDLAVLTSGGQFPCHLPCTLNVPSGMIQLVSRGLDQRFELELPVARFRVRAGEPVPWTESLLGLGAGLALGAVGTWAALTSTAEDEVAGGVALVVLGVLLFGVSLALIIAGLVEQNGAIELDTFEAALRDGVAARF